MAITKKPKKSKPRRKLEAYLATCLGEIARRERAPRKAPSEAAKRMTQLCYGGGSRKW